MFSKHLDRALRAAHRIEAGWVQVNRSGGQLPGMSYGGKKLSGLGSEYSIEGALESFTQRKSITVGLATWSDEPSSSPSTRRAAKRAPTTKTTSTRHTKASPARLTSSPVNIACQRTRPKAF